MVQAVRVNGLKEVTQFMKNLPKHVDRELKDKGMMEIARNLQRRIKYRAPKGPTGWLKRSVMVEKDGKWISVSVHAFYAMAVEEGRGPNKSGNYYIPLDYLQQHSSVPEAPGNYVRNPTSFVNLRGSIATRPRPFIRPAIQSWLPKINSLLNKQINKALSSADTR